MYTTTYKINNSYTIYTVHHTEDSDFQSCQYRYRLTPRKWTMGCRVKHFYHGTGTVIAISNNQLTVYFKKANAHVTFKFRCSPSEIDSLWLCN